MNSVTQKPAPGTYLDPTFPVRPHPSTSRRAFSEAIRDPKLRRLIPITENLSREPDAFAPSCKDLYDRVIIPSSEKSAPSQSFKVYEETISNSPAPPQTEPIVISVSSPNALVSSVIDLLPSGNVPEVNSKLVSNTKLFLAVGATMYLVSKLLSFVTLMVKIFIIMPIVITLLLATALVIAFSRMSYQEMFSTAGSQICKLFRSKRAVPQTEEQIREKERRAKGKAALEQARKDYGFPIPNLDVRNHTYFGQAMFARG